MQEPELLGEREQGTQVGSESWLCTIEGRKRLFVRKQWKGGSFETDLLHRKTSHSKKIDDKFYDKINK